MQNNSNSDSLLVGLQKGTALLEYSLVVFYEGSFLHNLTIKSSSQSPKYVNN